MNIYQKLIEVRKAVPYLQKNNKGYKFDYVSSSDTIIAVRKAMDDNHLLLVPSVIESEVRDKATRKGDIDLLTILKMEFVWINAEKPEEKISCLWYGQGVDSGEKGVGKAMTYAEKYFLLKFFNIPTDKDDPDSFQKKSADKEPIEKIKEVSQEKLSKEGEITKKQIKQIHAIKNELGLSDEDYKSHARKAFGVETCKKLTGTQAKEFITYLKGLEKERSKESFKTGEKLEGAEAVKVEFGKHKGMELGLILEKHPDYVEFLASDKFKGETGKAQVVKAAAKTLLNRNQGGESK